MKNIWEIVKKALLWVVVALFILLAISSLPHFSGFLSLLVVVLVIPINKWQEQLKKIIKHGKSIMAVILAIVVVFTLPGDPSSNQDGEGVPGETPAIVTTQKATTTATKSDTTTTLKSSAVSVVTTLLTTSADITEKTSGTTSTTQKLTTSTTTKKPANKTTTVTTTTRTTKTTTSRLTTTKATTTSTRKTTYVLNTETKKFHSIFCKRLPTKNREDTTMSREEIVELGYEPCGICKP